jgi:nardilysin
MHLYSEENIIYGDYSFEQWDPDLVADLLKRINPSNMRLDIVTKSFNRNAPGTLL